MRILVIANPVAGGGKGEETALALQAALEQRGVEADLFLTKARGDARKAASKPGYDGVASIGGDGSASEVVNGLADSDAVLAILPMGTANVVAKELQLPADPEVCADKIVEGKTRRVDVGLHKDRRFILGASAGYDAAIIRMIHKSRGSKLGFTGWVRPTLEALFKYKPRPITVRVDGREVATDAHYVIVRNCRYTAGFFPFTPDAETDDGMMHVCVMRHLSGPRLVWMALRSLLPGFTNNPEVCYEKGTTVELTSTSGAEVPMQIDGDPEGSLPATFKTLPHAQSVII